MWNTKNTEKLTIPAPPLFLCYLKCGKNAESPQPTLNSEIHISIVETKGHNPWKFQTITSETFQTRCRPSKGRQCIPDVIIWVHVFVTSQNLNFKLFWKFFQIFGFPCCSTREDLSIDISITNVGLIAIDEAKMISAFQHKSKFEFQN